MRPWLRRHWHHLVLGLVVFIIVPAIWGRSYYLDTFNLLGIYSIVIMGLVLVSGYTGQISLGHNAFFGLGGYGAALVTTKLGLHPWVGLVAGLAAALVIGYLIALASLRVTGYYLVITTLVLGWVIWSLAIAFPDVTGGSDGVWNIPNLNAGVLELKTNFQKYFLIWIVTLAVFFISLNIGRSKVGRTLKAVRSNEILARASGIDAARYKIQVMLYSAVTAAVAGFLLAHYRNEFGPPVIAPDVGISFMVTMALGGAASIPGTFLGVGLMKLLPEFFEFLSPYKILAYGLIMVFILIFMPEGLAGAGYALARRLRRVMGRVSVRETLTQAEKPGEIININSLLTVNRESAPSPHHHLMVAEGLFKSFGGVLAVNDLGFSVARRQIKAIIGPNGAGKSTLFKIINGIIPADAGKNVFKGKNTLLLQSYQVTRLGLCLTFQIPQLFDNLSVLENVMVGGHKRTRAGWLQGAVPGFKSRLEDRRLRQMSLELLNFVGLVSQAGHKPVDLPYAQRKLVDVARALATDPEVLCLDEPAGGLNETEKEVLARIIKDITGLGITILLVEHDMNFVMNLAQEVLVMNFGQKIAEGSPREVTSNEEVIKAYLGVEEEEILMGIQ